MRAFDEEDVDAPWWRMFWIHEIFILGERNADDLWKRMYLIRTINTFAYSQHLTSLGNQHWPIQGINPFPQEYQFLWNQCPSATHFLMLINNFYIDYLLLKGHQHYPSQRSLSRANNASLLKSHQHLPQQWNVVVVLDDPWETSINGPRVSS